MNDIAWFYGIKSNRLEGTTAYPHLNLPFKCLTNRLILYLYMCEAFNVTEWCCVLMVSNQTARLEVPHPYLGNLLFNYLIWYCVVMVSNQTARLQGTYTASTLKQLAFQVFN